MASGARARGGGALGRGGDVRELQTALQSFSGSALVWPQSCGQVDVLKDKLFGPAPYIRGALFYRAVALHVGADKLDQSLGAFYKAHKNEAAGMADMLATLKTETGYDPSACAERWLRSTTLPTPGPCPR